MCGDSDGEFYIVYDKRKNSWMETFFSSFSHIVCLEAIFLVSVLKKKLFHKIPVELALFQRHKL